MNKTKLSIVIPCWNGAQYLSDLLDSIIEQSYKDWQVIIVDDQSTDNSLSIMKKYHSIDSRIKFVVRDRMPKGAQTCRNIGFEMSRESEYIIFFDSDDIVAPYCFQQRVSFMDNNPELDFAVAPAISYNENNDAEINCLYGVKMFNESDLETFFYGELPFVVWNNIYRTTSLFKYKMSWDENVLSKQDSLFNIVSLLKGMRYAYIENSLIDYYWRIVPNSNSITHNINNVKHFESHLYLLRKLLETIRMSGNFQLIKPFKYYIFSYYNIFASTGNAKYVKEILDFDIVKEDIMFSIQLKMYSSLPLQYLNNRVRGWLITLIFPRFRRSMKEYHLKRQSLQTQYIQRNKSYITPKIN